MRTPLLLTLAAALFTSPGAEASAAPLPRPATPVGPQPIARPLTRAQLQPKANVGATAVLADLLVRYADGNGTTRLEKAIGTQLGKTPKKLEAARRLATRWRSAPIAVRNAVLGRPDVGNVPALGALRELVASVSPAPVFALRPTIPLSPEKLPAPTTYALELSGIQAIAADDVDARDELATLTIFATASGKNYTLTTRRSPEGQTIDAPLGATTAVGATLYEGAQQDMLVITALVEDVGGTAAAAIAETEVLVDLAVAVAKTLDGADRLAVLQAMVDTTVTLQDLGAGAQAATRSLASVRIHGGDWFALWGVDSSTADGVPWKLAVPHAIGAGKYELLLDVPSVLPELFTVRVTIDEYRVENFPTLVEMKPLRMTLKVNIKGAEHNLVLDRDAFVATSITLERKVLFGDVPLAFSGALLYHPTASDKLPTLVQQCDAADWWPEDCALALDTLDVDLAPGNAVARSATYSMRDNKLTGRLGTNKLRAHGTGFVIGSLAATIVDVAQ